MWNEPTADDLGNVPPLYSTSDTPWEDTVIYEHFFLGGCDWYLAEYDPEERILFGYAILYDDFDNAEWGYASYDEIRSLRTPQGFEVDRDLHWRVRRAREVDRIRQAYRI